MDSRSGAAHRSVIRKELYKRGYPAFYLVSKDSHQKDVYFTQDARE